jgi:hypothetical protein
MVVPGYVITKDKKIGISVKNRAFLGIPFEFFHFFRNFSQTEKN